MTVCTGLVILVNTYKVVFMYVFSTLIKCTIKLLATYLYKGDTWPHQ